jgi:hypothetical protein
MAMRVVLAAAVSAILMFVWGFVFWGPVLGMTAKLLSPLPAESELDVIAPLRAANVPDGMYVYPGPLADMNDKESTETWEKKIKEGPVLHMAYHQQGISPMDPMMFAKGLGHSFVMALLAGLLLVVALPALPSYGGRVGFLLFVSVIAALWTTVSDVIWWAHPPRYASGQIAYIAVSGLLMALATAAMVRPAPAAK